jgi:FAD/FMN-containing dehydrogenase
MNLSETQDRAEILKRFVSIVGERNALREPSEIDPFLVEPRGRYHGKSGLVLKPGSTAEVSSILKLASETGTPIVPQSGNTGLVGGQVPDESGRQVVVSLSRMDGLRELDADGATVTVEAGMILQNLHDAADKAGFLFPLTLASQGSCQIGGNLSSNAGGTAVLAYGNARDLCLGLEVVLPTGEVLDDLRKLKKDNTGYDLKDLFVGAEGTLGIITAAVLKLFPKPAGRLVSWIGLKNPNDALALFRLASARAGTALTTFELVEATALELTLKHFDSLANPLAGGHRWYVMLEISSNRSDADARQLGESILEEAYSQDILQDAALSESLAQVEAFWNIRELIPDAQKREGASIKHDISVPVPTIPRFIEMAGPEVLKIVPGARIVCFGHMGDGNLHYNISPPEGGDEAAFMARYGEANKAVYAIVRKLDGSFSAEHGIGQLKRGELFSTAPPVAIDLMRRIKAAFDPAGIMNPGKVV